MIDFVLNKDENFEKEADLKEYLAELKEIAAIYNMQVAGKCLLQKHSHILYRFFLKL